MNKTWLLECINHIAILTYNNPPKNFINYDTIGELDTILNDIENDSSIKVVIIKSGISGVFISGVDVSIFRNNNKKDVEKFVLDSRKTYKKLETMSKPIIASIDGICLGGGFEFILCCDIRVSTEISTFGFPEIIYGLIPGGGGIQRIARLTSKGRALKMMLTGFSFKAKEAFDYGIIDEICQGDKVMDATMKIAKRIAIHSPLATNYIKKLVNEGMNCNFDNACEMDMVYFKKMLFSEDSVEGLNAFSEKRMPKYTGK